MNAFSRTGTDLYKGKYRILCILLTISLIVSLVPATVFAAEIHKIVIDSSICDGIVEADKDEAISGETVTLNVVPDNGFTVRDWPNYMVDDNQFFVEPDDAGNLSFEMPDCDITIHASFEGVVYIRFSDQSAAPCEGRFGSIGDAMDYFTLNNGDADAVEEFSVFGDLFIDSNTTLMDGDYNLNIFGNHLTVAEGVEVDFAGKLAAEQDASITVGTDAHISNIELFAEDTVTPWEQPQAGETFVWLEDVGDNGEWVRFVDDNPDEFAPGFNQFWVDYDNFGGSGYEVQRGNENPAYVFPPRWSEDYSRPEVFETGETLYFALVMPDDGTTYSPVVEIEIFDGNEEVGNTILSSLGETPAITLAGNSFSYTPVNDFGFVVHAWFTESDYEFSKIFGKYTIEIVWEGNGNIAVDGATQVTSGNRTKVVWDEDPGDVSFTITPNEGNSVLESVWIEQEADGDDFYNALDNEESAFTFSDGYKLDVSSEHFTDEFGGAFIVVVFRFTGWMPKEPARIGIQITNNDGANATIWSKFDTETEFTPFTEANYDSTGNIWINLPEGASTITFKVEPGDGFDLQDCTILCDDQDVDEEKTYWNDVIGDGYEYAVPGDAETIIFRASFGYKLLSWSTVSWDGGNVQVENGQVDVYAVHVGDITYSEDIDVADDENKIYPLSNITVIPNDPANPLDGTLRLYGVAFMNGTDLFISENTTEDVVLDFRFVPDYGYQVTDIHATEESLFDEFTPGTEISTFSFDYELGTNVHFIVEFSKTDDIIDSTESSAVDSAYVENGENAISSGNLLMNITDVGDENVSDGLKEEVGANDAIYLDMSLYQIVEKGGENGVWENQLEELDGEISISLLMSNLDPNSEYYIVREHETASGMIYDEIPSVIDFTEGSVSFNSDKFSTYALVKVNEPEPTGVEGFVDRCYTVILGREPEEAGMQNWMNALNNGTNCGAQVAYGFIFSQEYINKNKSDEEFVTDLYLMFFGREPDTAGLNNWLNQLNAKVMTKEQVFAAFAKSAEYKNICSDYGILQGCYIPGYSTASQTQVNLFVYRLYSTCLGRNADIGGLENWSRNILAGNTSGYSAALGFFTSAEYQNLNKSDEDFIKDLYLVMMDRNADAAGLKNWVNQLTVYTKEEVIKMFCKSTEYRNICASYGINVGV